MPDVVYDEGVVAPAQDRKALEALVVDNEDLEQLEALLDQFNIFEAIGAVRQELRHSAMLAFLLDPRQNHGLGDVFFKRLLQRVLISAAEGRTAARITAIDLDIGDFTEMMVLREWHNIDVLVLAESHHVAIIIENKINTNEHSDQLRRYYHAVEQHYPGWRIVGLYLTPGGLEPSDPRYYATDYVMIAALVESLAVTRASTLGADIHVLMTHYAQMLRRHIVADSEIAELCARIYRKHQRALDLIYEHRPDLQSDIRGILEELIHQTPDVVPDHSNKSYIRCTCSPARPAAGGQVRLTAR